MSSTSHKGRAQATFLQVLPRRVVRYRELRQVSQSQLARAARISRSTLNAIESGLAHDMKVSTLERLCVALGVSADALLGYDLVLLVREPLLRGLRTEAGLQAARRCITCGQEIAARALHLPGDCMLVLSDAGESAERIGAVFGLAVPAIECVLRGEHETRRHRRF